MDTSAPTLAHDHEDNPRPRSEYQGISIPCKIQLDNTTKLSVHAQPASCAAHAAPRATRLVDGTVVQKRCADAERWLRLSHDGWEARGGWHPQALSELRSFFSPPFQGGETTTEFPMLAPMGAGTALRGARRRRGANAMSDVGEPDAELD